MVTRLSIAFILVLPMLVFGQKQFPIFIPTVIPPENDGKIPDFLTLSASSRERDWYASWPTNLKLVLIGNLRLTYFWKCNVLQLKKDDALEKLEFCFNPVGGGENCKSMIPGMASHKMKVGASGDAVVSLDFNYLTGGSASVTNVGKETDMSSVFYCKATNRRGTVTSNKVHILDIRRQFADRPTAMINNPAPPYHIDSPAIFKCSPKPMNIPQDVSVIYAWYTCGNPSVTKLRMCSGQDITKITTSNPWPRQILKDGSLYIPYFPPAVRSMLQGDRIFCNIDAAPTVFYQTPFAFKTTGGNKITKLKITNPPDGRDATVKLLNSHNTFSIQSCNFEIGPGAYTIRWQHSANGKTVNLDSGSNTLRKVNVDKNSLTFVGDFSEETAGRYTCIIEWTPEGGAPSQTKMGSFVVTLLHFPKMSPKMVPVKYVLDKSDGVVQCLFEKNEVTPSLAINGINVDLSDKAKFEDSLKQISARFSKYMAPLNSEVTPYKPGKDVVITYTAKKMAFSFSLDVHRPSTQTVTCKGENANGAVRHSTMLRVIPMPEVAADARPSIVNCSQCSAKTEHVFKCVITNKDAFNASDFKVIFSQTWMLGNDDLVRTQRNHRESKSGKYFVISEDLETLTVKKIDDEEFKSFVNTQGEIACVIKLAYPKNMKKPDGIPTSGPDEGVFFTSTSNAKLKSELTTSIQLVDIAPPAPKAASLSWAIALGLSILVVLIVIILVVVWCRKRPPGETYDVDHTEKKQGNDPEAENHEKEAFPVYERPEDGPIRGSRASLDDSIQVGSDDEDEDLAEYDVDIGKFNEEGSFIGQYAVNEGGGGGGHQNNSRRLPHVSTNTEV